MKKTLADFEQSLVGEARVRVRRGAAFLDRHFSGWRSRVEKQWTLLDMGTSDYCTLALAGKGQLGPDGNILETAGDVCRAFSNPKYGFDDRLMGFYEKDHIPYEILHLAWEELLFGHHQLPVADHFGTPVSQSGPHTRF